MHLAAASDNCALQRTAPPPLNGALDVAEAMRFNVYGRFELEIMRDNEAWVVFRLVPGKRVRAADLVIPSEIRAGELATYLDDVFHELAQPGDSVTVVG